MNWSIENGTYYVSRNGDDVNSGGLESPLRTMGEAISRAEDGDKLVLGTGQYLSEIDLQNKSLVLEADGWVELDEEAQIIRPGAKTILIGLQIKTFISGDFKQLNRCLFFNATIDDFSGIIYHCLFSDSTLDVSGSVQLINGTLESSSLSITNTGTITQCVNTHIGRTSSIELLSSDVLEFNFCNIQEGGAIKIDGVSFIDLPSLRLSFPQFLAEAISEEPKFGSEELGIFTLSGDSELISGGKLGKFIGAFNYGVALTSANNGFQINDDLVIDDQGFYGLKNGVNETTILSNPIRFSIPESIETIHLSAIQCFLPEINAIVSERSDLVNGGLDFRFRFATNEDALLLKEFQTLQWNSSPLTSNSGNGFGSQRVLFFQLEVVLRQESFSRFLLQESGNFILQENLSKIIIEP